MIPSRGLGMVGLQHRSRLLFLNVGKNANQIFRFVMRLIVLANGFPSGLAELVSPGIGREQIVQHAGVSVDVTRA